MLTITEQQVVDRLRVIKRWRPEENQAKGLLILKNYPEGRYVDADWFYNLDDYGIRWPTTLLSVAATEVLKSVAG